MGSCLVPWVAKRIVDQAKEEKALLAVSIGFSLCLAAKLRAGRLVIQARADLQRGNSARAIDHLGTALRLDPRLRAWRAERARLLATVWGSDFDGAPNIVDVYVGYLRSKFEQLGAREVQLRTVRGVGFRLVVDPSEAALPAGEEGGRAAERPRRRGEP